LGEIDSNDDDNMNHCPTQADKAMQLERERYLEVGTLYVETKDIITARRLQREAASDFKVASSGWSHQFSNRTIHLLPDL